MRKPSLKNDFDNGDGTYDHEGFDDALGDYSDAERDRELEERWEREEEDTGDQIHEQRKDEKDANK